jgi:putative transposase
VSIAKFAAIDAPVPPLEPPGVRLTKVVWVAHLTAEARNRHATFFDFPAEHWDHLRTSNPIESVFATVRHRTVRTKGALSATTAKLMVFKLVIAAAKTWRRLKGEDQLPKFVRGVKFQNSIEIIEMPAHHAA